MVRTKGKAVVRGLIRAVDSTVNLAVLVTFLFLLAYGCYGMWDSHQIYQEASAEKYEIYKPSVDNSLSFEEFCDINPEVFGWLNVYGTGIDYPIVQSEDSNEKYLNTDASGNYSLSGSLFLDYRNQKDLMDFNSIIYGHHMEKGTMFGDIGKFFDEEYFNSHKHGTLFYDGQEHGLEFWAALGVNAYDTVIYQPAITDKQNQSAYINWIQKNAINIRNINITPDDKLVLLSTCASQPTDGRHILIGRITDKIYPDTFKEINTGAKKIKDTIDSRSLWTGIRRVPVWGWICMAGLFIVIAIIITRKRMKHRKNK